MKYKTYWFITTMRDQDKLEDGDRRFRQRTWGFLDDLQEAKAAVEKNDGDIYECEYEYAVIEGHYMGTLAMSTNHRFWFKWNKEKEKFEETNEPSWAHNILNWGIG